jgi:cytidylate kinase
MAIEMPPPVLAVDGPSGAGKGTVSQRVADALGWHYLDSGAIYRVLGLAAARAGVALDDVQGLCRLAEGLEVEFLPQPADLARVLLEGEDVSAEVRTEQAGNMASKLAVLAPVREALLGLQRRLCRLPGLVADGRDMGTVVFPDAVLKVFLTASPEVRAQRRHKQLKEKGLNVSLPRLILEIRERDQRDASREASPLKPADDACHLDTSNMSIEDVASEVLNRLRDRLGGGGGARS